MGVALHFKGQKYSALKSQLALWQYREMVSTGSAIPATVSNPGKTIQVAYGNQFKRSGLGKLTWFFVTLQKDIQVCHDDQMKINLFARKNGHLLELKEQIEQKEVTH